MPLLEVTTPGLAREFIEFPVRLYRGDKNYIRPLDKDIEQVFDPAKNKLLREGSACIRWLLTNNQGQTIGRVAAFVNDKTTPTYEQPTGGMGFFDCIDDQTAANTLFETCRDWLKTKGMEAMDGPINLGDRDKWWGLLVQDFSEPTYAVNYNFPYYQRLFETYGFREFYKQYTYFRRVDEKLTPEYQAKAEAILKDPNYHFEHVRKNNLAKYAEDFRQIYNKAWVKHQGVKEMTAEQALKVMNTMKPILDEKIVWFAYYQEEPVGFFIGLPELNKWFKHVDGKLNLIGKLKVAYHRWRGTNKTMYGIAFGITPDHQGKAVEAAFITAASWTVQDKRKVHYVDFYMNWIGDFNPKMMAVAEQIGGRIAKTHITYRYLFDRSKAFKRMEVIE
ncbi:MAG: hypothetical protein LH606_02040 [Cytophagaceae bacterium]|nr:hypothetical protein [Cytophagaceae bacterium]